MDKYKVVIVDDDEVALKKLSIELRKNPYFSLDGTARNGKQGEKLITKIQPDLLFLDVEMPDMTGLDYEKYMIHAIRESVFDYLLKSFEGQELKNILTRFMAQMETEPKKVLPIGASLYMGQTFIVFTPTNDMRALRPAEIVFFRYCAERKQWEVILNSKLSVVLRRGMTAEQIIKYSPCFVQIHQSYIINIDYLMIIKDNKCILYPPFDNVTELLLSRKYKKELQDRFCL